MSPSPVVYQHPLAYLLGLEGMALLRAFAGEHDSEFVLRRFAEIQRLLDAEGWGEGVHATPMSIEERYRDRHDERRMARASGRHRLALPASVTRGQRDHCVTGLSCGSPSSSRSTRSP